WREVLWRHATATISLGIAAAFAAAWRHPGWSARGGSWRGGRRRRGLRLRFALLCRRLLLRGALLGSYLFLLFRRRGLFRLLGLCLRLCLLRPVQPPNRFRSTLVPFHC